ncbi:MULTISPECIES: hypothetical protein [unclassified Mesorhizobium]|uniref:hypothetical protein n=1 Tax=unclassified Mesorhizobium TaxID=325217 RepID=UPI00112EDBF8|nr:MULTISPECIES: hypothetical protein [unclassified Mesorhizobium]TPJ44605.1 hypothetical protein FJ437_19270 [Mesorhizobium sp. B2-6-6]MCA0000914.1 hypothetical protein [Mesorhizobium sp. B264B2A]MCA0004663.1 hypothetical protein [Mesorhizobium sp. B264B1B]MCA0019138.1 hypothetical protein [Mesorhizobium sp. B264B1A]TPJ56512.1 hypothetical protein FJ462_32765 [Mesorhizobium sp. B2-6-7]
MEANAVNETTWKFEVGAWITHKDRPMPSLVVDRVRTNKGVEIYGVRSFAVADPNRDRMILGEFLRTIDDDGWADCLLTPEMAAKLANRTGV